MVELGVVETAVMEGLVNRISSLEKNERASKRTCPVPASGPRKRGDDIVGVGSIRGTLWRESRCALC